MKGIFMKQPLLWLVLVLGLVVTMPTVKAGDFQAGEAASIDAPLADDAYLAGSALSVKAPVTGDTFLAGKKVTVTGDVSRSVFAAGNDLTISGDIGYNGFVAGQTVLISGNVGHDLLGAGQTLTLDTGTITEGNVHLVGSDITLHGHIKGDVYVAAQNLTSDAVIDGTLTADVETTTFTGGSIGGDFVYGTDQAVKDANKVTITGSTTQKTFEDRAVARQHRPFRAMGSLIKLLSGLVLGVVLLLAVPALVGEVRGMVGSTWSRSFGVGLMTLIVWPIVSVLVLLTGIGVGLGVIGLFAYCILVMLAGSFALLVLGNTIVHRSQKESTNTDWWLSLLVGAVVVAVGVNLPVVGGILSIAFFFAVIVPTLGALTLASWQRLTHTH